MQEEELNIKDAYVWDKAINNISHNEIIIYAVAQKILL
jgi:hypothetical protein